MIKTIIFDYDGTIHQTLGIYEPAFRETYQWLTEQKVAAKKCGTLLCRNWIRNIKIRQAKWWASG